MLKVLLFRLKSLIFDPRIPPAVYQKLCNHLGLTNLSSEAQVSAALQDVVASRFLTDLEKDYAALRRRFDELNHCYFDLKKKYCAEHYKYFESEQTNNVLARGIGAIVNENEELSAENERLRAQLGLGASERTPLRKRSDEHSKDFLSTWQTRLDAITNRSTDDQG